MKFQLTSCNRARARWARLTTLAAVLGLLAARPASAQYPGPGRIDGSTSSAGSGKSSGSRDVSDSYDEGKRAFEAGDYDRAVMILSLAEKKHPKNLDIRMSLQRAREKDSYMHSDRGRIYLNALPPRYGDALAEFQLAFSVFEGNTFARDNYERCVKLLEEQRSKTHLDENSLEAQKKKSALDTGVPVLKPRNTDPLSIDMEDKPQRQALEAISKATGISFIYDERLEQDIDRKRISLHIKNASFVDTMEILLTKTNTMYQIINDTTLLLAPNNPESERKYQDLVMKTFYLSNAQAKDVFQQVRSIIDVKKLSQNEQLNSITMRGSPDQIAMAQKIIDLNDKSKGEVVIDVEILEVNKTLADNIGLLLGPRTFSLSALTRPGVSAANATLFDWSRRYNLKSKSQWHVDAMPSASVSFLHSDGDTKTLANPSVRVTEGEKADLHIGDRFPIFNCTTTGTTVPGGVGNIGCTPTYTDIGIQIKLEPRVHHNQEVSIKLDLKITSLGATVNSQQGSGGQTAPAIGERSINTVIRMADGETEMLAGMLRDDDSKSYDGYPWIEKVPLLRALFGNHSNSHHKTDVILLLTPHVIRFPNITEEDLQANWVGTEESPRLKTPSNSHRLNVVAAAAGDDRGDAAEEHDDAAPAGQYPVGGMASPDKSGKPPAPGSEGDKKPPEKTDPATGGTINLSLAPSTLVVQAGKPADIHVMAAGVSSLSKFGFTLRHGQLPLQCNSAMPGELFTSGGGQPEMQFAPLPGGDCQITLTRGGGNSAMATGEVATVSITVPLHGQDIINAINFEAFDGKGNPLPVIASPMQIKVE
jgi:general secretion pathway protein D